MNPRTQFALLLSLIFQLTICSVVDAQTPRPAERGRAGGPQIISPEVSADRHVTFRIVAPKAERVRLSGGDIPGNGPGAELTKGTNDVWEVVVGPLPPGAYRYNFNVDGLSVIDP